MADRITPAHRSWNMSRIRGRDTTPEKLVRSALHRVGFRFRLNVKDLPGRPDIVLPRYNTVVLVHGCFWHRHRGCSNATTPSTNRAFWGAKFDENKARDVRNLRKLRARGWNVHVIWECEADSGRDLKLLLTTLKRRRRRLTNCFDVVPE